MNLSQTMITHWPRWRTAPSAFKIAIALFWHGLTVLALYLFETTEFVLFILTTYITLQFGLVMGYHRLLSHRCFETSKWFRRLLSLIGTLAMQNGPISWVAIHRFHHKYAEQEFDPHSPSHGLSWAHFFWTFYDHPVLSARTRMKIARDVQTDPFIRFCEEKFLFVNLVAALAAFLTGAWIGGLWRGIGFLTWIICARAVFLWHVTFLTNSIGHKLGYRNFDTRDDSRNVYLLGIMALGDGWHNNHHAFPHNAAHGLRWFEIDITYRLIQILEHLGVARNVRHPKLKSILSAANKRNVRAPSDMTDAPPIVKGCGNELQRN
jgi:fatty-acid desaturase